ncbi:MAG: serine/threonine protein kinase [Candidatus Sericytochromatia bacterium]
MDFTSLKTAYVILREIGRGGMGVVFQAWDRRLERYVALKLLSLGDGQACSDSAPPDAAVELFLQEAKAVARLNHPNIVTLYDIGGNKGRYYLVMEYIEGFNLEVLQKQHGKVPEDMVVSIGTQLCEALDYAHRQGIVHRDVKPANVLLNGEGGIKLMDFGIARIQRKCELECTQGEMLGSVLYMAPEQLVDASQADQRADIYALGVTLFELLCGARPFQHEDIPKLIRQIMMEPAPTLAACGAEVAPALEAVIRKALNKDPADRFQSAAEMLQALNRINAPEPRFSDIPEPAAFSEPMSTHPLMPAREELYAYVCALLS